METTVFQTETEGAGTAADEPAGTEICENGGSLCEQLYEWTGSETFAETTTWLLGTPTKLLVIAVGALVLNRVLRGAAGRLALRLGRATEGTVLVSERSSERSEERARTISALFKSIVTAVVFTVAFIMMFEVLGVSLVPIIASAGVLSLAIGFGAQSVIEDLLRGVFMLIEDQFGVGDQVEAGPVNGTVERITLRTAVIRDADGVVWHIPNSEINWVANESQQWQRAVADIGVSYQADLREASAVLGRAADELATDPEWADAVSEPPRVLGVQELGDDAVVVRVVVMVDGGRRRAMERALRQHLKEALDRAGIEMPNRQVDVWMRTEAAAA